MSDRSATAPAHKKAAKATVVAISMACRRTIVMHMAPYGPERVQDFPVAENLMTATAMGAALTGLRPLIVHQRLDFMIYSLDAIVNWLALWRFKSNGKSSMPVTIRTIVGKGWGQGPQHSKSLHSWFSHLPGLRVAVPATAFDAKGLLLESLFSQSPAIFVEGRGLYSMTDHVPEEPSYGVCQATGKRR